MFVLDKVPESAKID